jgi:phenylacetate-CoA ligase
MTGPVPAELRARCPLITVEAAGRLRAMVEHPDAPPWDYHCGNRVIADDLPGLAAFTAALAAPAVGARIPGQVLQTLAAAIPRTPILRRLLSASADLERDWYDLPTTSRADLAAWPSDWIPDDADWSRLVCHGTSGTTGHPIIIPHHPAACAAYEPLYAAALATRGVRLRFDPDRAACLLLCAQRRTIRYATVCALWDQGLHAKVNLSATDWPRPDSARRFLADHDSTVYTGDTDAFAALLGLADAGLHPQGLISTAMPLPPALAERLEAVFGCPVLDIYSLNETGPLAWRCPQGHHHVLPPDVVVEVLDARGRPCAEGVRGEITVSGGRNPNLPLWRYRTGDHASLRHDACPCGDPRPRLVDLEGRAPVRLVAADGGTVATVDISRELRRFHLLRHRLVQRADRRLELTVLPLPGDDPPGAADLAASLRSLFGDLPTSVTHADRDWGGGGKGAAYVADW